MGTVHIRRMALPFEIRDADGPGDGRTVYGRVVPFGEVIEFVDPYDGDKLKRERFIRGALARQADAWHRVSLTFEHYAGFQGTIGYGRSLQELPDGAWATFRLFEADAPKAREALTTSHKGLSLEFLSLGNDREGADGVIDRTRVHVQRVAAVPDSAYAGAGIVAVRGAEPVATPNLDAVLAELAELRERGPS
jgi:hypothetical protein